MSDFSQIKAAQAAAYFVHCAPSNRLSVLKLMKLLYLAERLSYQRFGEPLTNDRLVSMPHGPVLSLTLNHMNGMMESCENGWDTWISDKENHGVSLRDPSMIRSVQEDLLALSDSDLEVLAEIWAQFGGFNQWELRDYTHVHCREWQDPDGSSVPICIESLLKNVGHSDGAVEAILAALNESAAIAKQFQRAANH